MKPNSIELLAAVAALGTIAAESPGPRILKQGASIPRCCRAPTSQKFKANRNRHCPCGSCKKFKHCCRV